MAIDYQENLVPAMHDKETIIANSQILLAGLELMQIPIMVTRQYPQGLGDTVEPIRQTTTSARVYDKTSFSCYLDGPIKAAIEASGRKQILLCGTEAHICVLQTAIDLLGAGYQVYYVVDCVASRRIEDKDIGIRRAALEGAFLTTYEAVLFELMTNTANPAFKGIAKLVK